jgi:Microcystin-dependent protein
MGDDLLMGAVHDDTESRQDQGMDQMETGGEDFFGEAGVVREGETFVPDEAVGYGDFSLPEGMVADEGMATEFRGLAKELNLPQGGAQKLVDFYAEAQAKQAREYHQQIQQWKDQVMSDAEMGGHRWSESQRYIAKARDFREELDRAVKMPETESGSGDFTHEIIGARVRAEQAASRAESAKNEMEEMDLQGEQFFQNTEAEANRARNEADRAERAAEEALGGGIRTVNSISGAEIELTPEDIGAAPKEHIHDIMEKIPEIKEENAGKSLIVNEMGTGCEWETVSGVPVGAIIAWAGNTPPPGYLECNGATLHKETYPGLFTAIGTLWGSESEDTFKLPDFYGAARFLRSRGNGLSVGEVQEDAIRNIKGEIASG